LPQKLLQIYLEDKMKNFELDFASATIPFNHYWELCVGSCHAATALREDYRRQLEQCRRELGFRYVRFHGLFDDDMSVLLRGNALMAREAGELVLSFTNTDSVFDFLLSIGMKPFIELGFMPAALTSGPCAIFHYQGHTSPPDDYGKWQWLVEQFTAHCVERYGLGEVRQWFFEVWNEPNLGSPDSPMGFWGGTMEDYFKLYRYAATGIKKVDPRLRVGGPATSDNAWIKEFLQYCRESDTPVDFVSTHHYPTDFAVGYRHGTGAKLFGAPKEITAEQKAEQIKEFIRQDENKWKIVPRGILTEFCKEARAEAEGLPLYYTEWNSGGGIDSDGPFGASFILKTCLDNHGLVEGYSYWTFSDIFEEGGMPHTPFHGGFGLLNLQGIPKAAYRAFELLHQLGGEIYETKLAKDTVDVYALKNGESGCVQILAVNHQSLQQEIETEEVSIRIGGLPGFVEARVERIDEDHGNALGRWRTLGSPDYPSREVVYELLSASCLKAEKINCQARDGVVDIRLSLPGQGAALVNIYY
jgi:xylan 1,4-beta-xylosidase